MNQIYWDVSQISMLTDNLGASTHSHGMVQFFLALENIPDIQVGISLKSYLTIHQLEKAFQSILEGSRLTSRNISRRGIE